MYASRRGSEFSKRIERRKMDLLMRARQRAAGRREVAQQ